MLERLRLYSDMKTTCLTLWNESSFELDLPFRCRIYIPLILSLPSTVLSLTSKVQLKVEVTTVFGSTPPLLTVHLVQAFGFDSEEKIGVESQELHFDQKSSVHYLDITPLKLDVGKYMLDFENFGPMSDTVFCGVFDGHGPYGHMVARRVRDHLPLKLGSHWEVNIASNDLNKENNSKAAASMNLEDTASVSINEESRASNDLEEKERHPKILTTLKESFLKAFKVMDKKLKLCPNIDCFCSGTTAVTLVKQGEDLIIGNIGDLRAVLATRDQNDSLVAVQLTVVSSVIFLSVNSILDTLYILRRRI